MSARTRHLLAVLLVVVALLASGCTLGQASQGHPTQVTSRAVPSSSLAIILDPRSYQAQVTVLQLLRQSLRPNEQLVLMDAQTGGVLASETVQNAPAIAVPGPPAKPASDATSFQRGAYRQAVSNHRHAVCLADRRLAGEQAQIDSRVVAAVARVLRQAASGASGGQRPLAQLLTATEADASSLEQAGVNLGDRRAVVVVGSSQIYADQGTVGPSPELAGGTVVLTDFPANLSSQEAWQASLLQGGADRAAVLTQAAGDQLASLVGMSLDGIGMDDVSTVGFALGQATLSAAGQQVLQHVLSLLQVRDPASTAYIDGYTDSLPAVGGNNALSVRRADAVGSWLVSHGVARTRLVTNGFGSSDPVATNSSLGQPLNRRVEVIVDAAVSAGTTEDAACS